MKNILIQLSVDWKRHLIGIFPFENNQHGDNNAKELISNRSPISILSQLNLSGFIQKSNSVKNKNSNEY